MSALLTSLISLSGIFNYGMFKYVLIQLNFIVFRFGKILIVQDVDSIDPILFPILRNDYVVQGDFWLLYPL